MTDHKPVFSGVYQRGEWGEGSGAGSRQMDDYLLFLDYVLDTVQPFRVVDLGCGFHEPYAGVNWRGASYLGLDAAPQVFEANQKYSGKDRAFSLYDWLNGPFMPIGQLAIVKDVLQHWSHEDVMRGLRRLNQYPWVLITNSIILGNDAPNVDIATGGCRPLNLMAPPYSLKPTDCQPWYAVANVVVDVKLSLLVRGSALPA